MKSKSKHLFVSLAIRNGEYEYTSQSAHEISTRKNTKKFGEDYAKTFYAGKAFKYSPDADWWNFNCGEVAVKLGTVEEISIEEFKILSKFQYK
jgi:hypothetical protein